MKALHPVSKTLSTYQRQLVRLVRGLLYVVPGLPFFISQRILKLLILVQVSQVRGDRLGHLIIESDLAMTIKRRERDKRPRTRGITVYFFGTSPINRPYGQALQHQLFFGPKTFLKGAYLLNRWQSRTSPYIATYPEVSGMADLSPLTTTSPWYEFDTQQSRVGNTLLSKLNLSLSDRFVCLFLRDENYGRTYFDPCVEAHQKYRNCRLETFLPAISYLKSEGFKVVLMGRALSSQNTLNIAQVVDYANSGLACDLGDLYLASRCDFAISCDTGAQHLATLFRKPLGVCNVKSPWGFAQGESVAMYLPKTWKDPSGRILTLRDLLFSSHEFPATGPDASFFDALSLRCVDADEVEILGFVQELLTLIRNPNAVTGRYLASSRQTAQIMSTRKPGNWNVRFPLTWLENRPNFLV